MKFKFGTKQIILSVVAVLLVAVMIAGNIVLNMYSPFFHAALGGAATGGGNRGGAHEGESPFEYASRISEESAEDSIVLLKNDEVNGAPYLPLPASTKFSIFGWGATDQGFLLSGGGSGGTNTDRDSEDVTRTTLLGAFREAQIDYFTDLVDAYSNFSDFDADYRSGNAGATNAPDAYMAAQNPGESFYTSDLMTRAKNYSQEAIVVLCRWGNENGGSEELKNIGPYSGGSYLQLTNEEKVMFSKLQEAGFNVTVLLNTTNYIEMSFLDDYSCIKAVMYVGNPGQSGAKAIPNLLVGSKIVVGKDGAEETQNISPSGRTSDTIANDWQSFAPSYNNAGVGGNVAYKEGIYVGYKWYETADAAGYYTKNGKSYSDIVRYPFGYGLSYSTFTQEITSFEHDGVAVKQGDEIAESGTYTMTVKVKNTGNYPGKEVVQLYYTPEYHENGVEKASVNLLAFAKTDVLQPAGSADGADEQEVTLTFDAYDMACYDCYGLNDVGTTGYEIDKGQYDIKLMKNAHEEIAGQSYSLHSTNGFQIKYDPFTGNEIKNLFTGDTAYANMPIDGSTGVTGGVTYLSRAGGFANYEQATTRVGAATAAAEEAKKFDYKGYDTDEIRSETSGYLYGEDNNLYITALEDGSKPALDDINGNSGATLTVNRSNLTNLIGDPLEDVWTMFLDQVTQQEIALLVAKGFFGTELLASVAKPHNADKDGPSGFNDNTLGPKGELYPFYPTQTLLGCSWDVDMMREIGRAQGQIGVQENLSGWYAPGVNLHRSPYNSRNYEYFSEDGVLSGWLAAGIINGAKEENVYCYLKHFALAESGQNSNEWFEWITEQALRENYCKAFEIAVKVSINPGEDESDPNTGKLMKNVKVSYDYEMDKLYSDPNGRPQTGANALMSAFNCVGGIWAGYNHALLTDMLRTEWGFQGSVITDYGQTYMQDFGRGLKAGNNLWMNNTNNGADINFNDAGEAYAARQALRGILFTYLDTLYTSGLETTVAAQKPFSALFVGLWVGIDVLLGLGIAACVVFFFWSPRKKKALAGGEEAPSQAEDVTEEPLQETAQPSEEQGDPPTPPDEA